jgi:hypothetical protein
MSTGADFDSPIDDARCFSRRAKPQAAEYLVFPVSAPPTQAPGIHFVPLLASGGHTKNRILQSVIGNTTLGDHFQSKLTLSKDSIQSDQSRK